MSRLCYVGFFFAGFLTSALFAQEPTPAGSAPEKQPAADVKKTLPVEPVAPPSEARRNPNQPPGIGHDYMVDRRLAAFVRLRELMFEHVKLDADKRKKIDTIFDDYMVGLLNPAFRPHNPPKNEDYSTPQELPELRKQLEAAEKAGDQEKIESFKAKIYAANITLEPHVVDEPIFFFNYVFAELSEEQKKQFNPIIERWRLLRVAELAPDNDFKQLRRAVRDPLLKRSEELGKKLDNLIIEGYRTIPLPERNDPSVMTKLANDTKPKALELLDTSQREQLEKALVMLEEWERVDPDVARKTRRASQRPQTYTSPWPERGRLQFNEEALRWLEMRTQENDESSTLGFRLVKTRWGCFGVVLSGEHRIAATYLPQEESSLRRALSARYPGIRERNGGSEKFCQQVRDYFSGTKTSWSVEIDLGALPEFRRHVLEACRRIPYGATASYADLARAVGSPGAARAVGSAMANNPLPLIVPCHRVVRSDGSLGGFSSPRGTSQKIRLLKLENPSLRTGSFS